MIHTFEALGQKIVADVYSGAVHILDDCAYEILNLMQDKLKLPAAMPEELQALSYDAAQLAETYEELLELQEAEMLFADDDYINPVAAMPKNAPIKALCLHVSHDCNLRCEYCFAATGDFGTGRKTMEFETAKRAIDFVIARSKGRRNIEVDFFGGEPLMAMDTVKQTIAYARSIEQEHDKAFRFTITTNGMLLNEETSDYINEEMNNCVMSLDGRACVNDRNRKTTSGAGSYDIIVPKFQKLVENRPVKDYYLRGTFTSQNFDSFSEDVMHMAQLGFRNVSVEPVVGGREDPYALREEDIPAICAEYERLAQQLLENPDVNFFHFNVDLEQGPCVIKRLRGCGAGAEYVAITPEGDIYPCHQFVGNEDYLLGNLYDETFNMEISDQFAGMNVYTREACQTCWAKFYCSGGCSASNLLASGDIKTPSVVGCELEKKRLECAIAMRAIRASAAE